MTTIRALPSLREVKPKTDALYTSAIRTILRGDEESLDNIANNFKTLVEEQKTAPNPLSTKTLNLYRSAVKKWINNELEYNQQNDLPVTELKKALKIISETNINLKDIQIGEQSKVGSKKFDPRTLKALKDNQKDKPVEGLLNFVEANLIVGLRPTEWASASFCSNVVDKRLCLSVKSAKYSEARGIGHGEYRLLDISSLTPLRKAILEKYIKYLDSKPPGELSDPRRYFHQLSVEFLRFKKQHGITTRETLYSTRHQAIANLKNSDSHTDKDVADMMGHKSNSTTARHHYGAKKNGSFAGLLPQRAKELGNHYEIKAEHALMRLVGQNKELLYSASQNLGAEVQFGEYHEAGSQEQLNKIHNITMIIQEVNQLQKDDLSNNQSNLDMEM